MATDVVTIWNQAISSTGGRGSVSSEDEAGREADLCRLWYPTVRDNVLKAATWVCARKSVRLALLAERNFNSDWVAGDPAPTWKYAYAQPSDLLAPRYLANYARFEREYYESENVISILTNAEDAVLRYVFRQEDVTLWDNGLEEAVTHSLAAQLCMPLNAKVGRAKELRDYALEKVLLAQTESANESDSYVEGLPSWVEIRGYENMPRQTKFFYPYEELLGVSV